MGGLRRAVQRQRRATPALDQLLARSFGNAFIPTQPGDPDFSLSTDPRSQAQFPAAAAEARLHDNRIRAANQLANAQLAGFDITQPEYEALRNAAQDGVLERKRTFGEALLGWVNAPFEFINLLIQDIVGGDETSAGIGDYVNALWGGIEDDEDFFKRTGLRPESMSHTLTMFGWEEPDDQTSWQERFLRGIVDFGASMLLDPLTYVTGGLAGLGRRAGIAAGRAAQAQVMDDFFRIIDEGRNLNKFGNVSDDILEGMTDVSDYAKHLARNRQSIIDDFIEQFGDDIDNLANGNFDSKFVRDLNRYLGKENLAKVGPLNKNNPFLNFEELALAHRIGEDILRPLSQRNFAAIGMKSGVHDIVIKELPVWARGGIRLGLPPMTQRMASTVFKEFPKTRGLGRKLLGDPMREISSRLKNFSPKYKKLAEAMSSGRIGFDAYRPIMNGLRDGTLKPWQFHIAAASMDAVNNQAFRQGVIATLHHHARGLNELADAAGIERERVYRTLSARMQGSDEDDVIASQLTEILGALGGVDQQATSAVTDGVNKNLDRAINRAAKYMRTTADKLHAEMVKLDPKFKEKYIEGYVPHIMTDEGKSIIDEFLMKAANVPINEWASAADRGEPGKGILARLINAGGKGGLAETNLGAARYLNEREIGRLQAQLLVTDGPVYLQENFLTDLILKNNAVRPVTAATGEVASDALKTKYATVEQLNEWLEAAVRENAEQYGIVLPRNWDGKIFKDNPLDAMSDYISAMDDTIKQWTMIDAMKMAGLTIPHRTAIDTQDVLQKIFSNINRQSKKIKVTPGEVSDSLRREIEEAPDQFVYHATTVDNAGNIISGGLEAGGLYSDREAAERFVRHGAVGPTVTSSTTPPPIKGLAEGQVRAIEDNIDVVRRAFAGNLEIQDIREFVKDKMSDVDRRTVEAWLEGQALDIDTFQMTHARQMIDEGVIDLAELMDELATNALNQVKNIAGKHVPDEILMDIARAWPSADWEDPKTLAPILELLDELKASFRVPLPPAAAPGGTRSYRVPRQFYDDHVARELPSGKKLSSSDGWVEVELTPEEFDELLDDAKYYATGLGEVEPGMEDLVESARRTVDELNKQVAQPSTAMPANRRVAVFRKEDLPPSIRSTIDRAGEIGDVRGAPRIKPVATYDPAVGLDSLQATEKVVKSTLEGMHSLVEGIPRRIIRGLKDSGFNVKNYQGVKKLYERMENLTLDQFHQMRAPKDDALDFIPAAGFNYNETDNIIQFAYDPALDAAGRAEALEAGIESLENLVVEGKISLDMDTMVDLVRRSPNEETTELLHAYFTRKVASLPSDVKDFLGRNPGEYTETLTRAQQFWDGLNEFLTDYSAYRTATDALVMGGRHAQQLAAADSPFAERLAALKAAARKLGDEGYEEAAKVMRQVDDWTGVADLPGYIKAAAVGLQGPAVAGMTVQRDVALWLKNVSKNMASIYTPEGLAAAKVATNKLLRTWRALATLPRPAFHIRNAVTAAWMNMSVGVSAKSYDLIGTNAIKWRKALREGLEDPLSVVDAEVRDVFEAMIEEDVLSGFVSAEFRQPLTRVEKEERLQWLKLWDPEDFVLTRMGGYAMESIEDIARAALFMEYYDPTNPASRKTAAEMVRAVHFDYSELTPWETKVKSLVPFFVWTRRNLPRQLEMMIERPTVIQKYRHMMQAMNDNLGGRDENGLPVGDQFSAFAAGTNIYVNPDTPFWARVMVDPDLGPTDLLRFPGLDPHELFEWSTGLLGPHITTPININEQREFGDVNAPAPFNVVLKGLAAIGFFDETLDGDVRIPYWMRTVAETALPFTREVVDPFFGGPTDPNRRSRQGIQESDNPFEAGLKSLGASLARGVGIKFATPVDARQATSRTQSELDELIKQLRLEGKLPPSAR